MFSLQINGRATTCCFMQKQRFEEAIHFYRMFKEEVKECMAAWKQCSPDSDAIVPILNAMNEYLREHENADIPNRMLGLIFRMKQAEWPTNVIDVFVRDADTSTWQWGSIRLCARGFVIEGEPAVEVNVLPWAIYDLLKQI